MIFPDIDPVIFSIGPLAVRWYALAYVAGILLGTYYAAALSARQALWTPQAVGKPGPQDIHDFMLWAILGVILGGRLGYVIFYHPAFYLTHPEDIFAVWRGGMSFHGGALGVIAAIVLFARRRGLSFLSFGDLAAAAVPIGLFFGRIANFINGELWGRVSDVPWAVVFPRAGSAARHPSQLYEALLEGLILFIILRLMTHYFKQLKYPGLLAGAFLALYAIMRIFIEFFREPDRHIGFLAGGLTMGMILSLPILFAGLALIFYARRKT